MNVAQLIVLIDRFTWSEKPIVLLSYPQETNCEAHRQNWLKKNVDKNFSKPQIRTRCLYQGMSRVWMGEVVDQTFDTEYKSAYNIKWFGGWMAGWVGSRGGVVNLISNFLILSSKS